jgi:hypothetical protein
MANLTDFVKKTSDNLGTTNTSLKTKKFNPFSTDNTSIMCVMYALLSNYAKNQNTDILIPNNVQSLPKSSKVRFSFPKEFNVDSLDEVIEKNKYESIQIIDSQSLEIDRKI